jgi:hypothetical protein
LSVFNAPLVTGLPGSPIAVATAHFRGASAPLDVVTGNSGGSVSVLLGNADGTFQNPVTLSVGDTPTAVAVGDLVGNGIQDIVTISPGHTFPTTTNGTVSVLLGNGNGTFQGAQTLTVTGQLSSLVLGDFLGDGRMEIVTASTNGVLSEYQTNSDGTLQTLNSQSLGLSSLVVGDFNGDGKLDLAGIGGSTVEVLFGNGDGTFRVGPRSTVDLTGFGAGSLQAADLNGDGKLDLVAITPLFQAFGPHDNVDVLLGNGDGTFHSPVTYQVGNNAQGLVVGNFNGHGNIDLAETDDSGVNVLVNNGDGTFQAARNLGFSASSLAAGDFLGNGRSDLVLASSSSKNVSLILSNGDGTFALPPVFATGLNSEAVTTGDLTGSGKQDIVQVDETGHVNILLNNGDGTFRHGATLDIPHNIVAHPFGPTLILSSVVVGDFLGNGKQDIAVLTYDNQFQPPATFRGERAFVYLGNGDGTFQDPIALDVPLDNIPIPSKIVAGDFTGNGRQDLAVVSYVGVYQVQVFLSNGDGTFTAEDRRVVSEDYVDVAVADLRGNGVDDLVFGSFPPTFFTPLHPPTSDGQVIVMLSNGDGTFQDPVTITSFGVRIAAIAVADFNGDGHPDIVASKTDGTVSVLLGNGDGTFQSPITSQFSPVETISNGHVAVGDFFGDGKLSLALTGFIGGPGANSFVLLRGQGDGTFQPDSSYLVTGILATGDFTGHGMRDLVEAGGNISVLLNQTSATAAPTVESMVVNDGAVQRSEVTHLTISFSTQVSLNPGALEVQRQDGSDVGINITTSVVGGKTVAVVTFTGSDIVDGSVPDGSYTLIVHHSLVPDGSGQTLAQDATLTFFRLLGDVDGDGVINDNDLAAAPTVTSVRLNEGDAAGAQVHSITVHFSETVTLGAGAFTLVRQDGSTIDLNVSTSEVNGDTVATITFSAPDLINGALPDGAYTFTIHGGQIHDGLGLALGHDFSGDRSADFLGADGSDQPDLVGLFHPTGS